MADTAAPAATAPAPQLDELMLAMDVVDTLRHQEKIVERELGQDDRDEALKARLRQIYESQGLEVNDHILEQGIKALKESRFVYTPPRPGFNTFLARMWIRRGLVATIVAVVLVLLVAVIGVRMWQGDAALRAAEELRIELTVTLPAALNKAGEAALAAASDAAARTGVEKLIGQGEAAVATEDGDGMRAAIAGLDALRAKLLQTYELRIVAREGQDTGVFRIPDVNEDARNYYLIVEAFDDQGKVLSLPIVNEESGKIETVAMWGVRVPKATYDAVGADKSDDGIVQDNILGEKGRGTLNVDYRMDVLDGAITDW